MTYTTQIAIYFYGFILYHVLVFSFGGSLIMKKRGFDQKTWCGIFLIFQAYVLIYIFLKKSVRNVLLMQDKLLLITFTFVEIGLMLALIKNL
jgi:hypothetical protein